MSLKLRVLLHRIETLRSKMHDMVLKKESFIDNEVVTASQMLDVLLMESYNYLIYKNRKHSIVPVPALEKQHRIMNVTVKFH